MAGYIGAMGQWAFFPWVFFMWLLGATTLLWFSLIDAIVPEPYLDEVFHVGQARAYLRGEWHVWDTKLTTPPGLYLASWVVLKPLLILDFLPDGLTGIVTNASALRSTNFFGSFVLAAMVHTILVLNTKVHDGPCEGKHLMTYTRCKRCPRWSGRELIHTGVNIYLFPPLFFFYGLYYTDVLSVTCVLYAYRCYLTQQESSLIIGGLLSLLFRQTNIFWVSVFLGGLELCRTIPRGRPSIEFPNQPTFQDIIEGSWRHASAYDPTISQACFEDYIKAGISYAIAGLANFSTVIRPLSPYLVILCAFAEFVFWNGGVVLGDKENHVASIHLTQMMYVWPYFAFFSWPLLYRQFLPASERLLSYPAHYPRKTIVCATMVVMLVVVRYNTIVHPFTLADNRHYMFYIFRILLRHPSIKYLAVLIYFSCAWATIAAIGLQPTARDVPRQVPQPEPGPRKRKLPGDEPFPPSPQLNTSPMKRSKSEESTLPPSQRPPFSPRMPPPTPKKQKEQVPGHRVSFILIWLLATALSIVTTPLVEPRYLIVPWLIWRLHMASPRPDQESVGAKRPNIVAKSRLEAFKAEIYVIYERHDHRLWLETVWFLAINLATGYIFLCWGFEWPQEPGKVQRFMW